MIDMYRKNQGFTMIELLITIAISTILLAIAAPSFLSLVTGNKLVSARDNLLNSFQLTKTEAISRNDNVSICPSSNGTSCTGTTDWSQGWIVYIDTGTGNASTVDTIIRVVDGFENINVVHAGHRGTLTPALFVRYIAQGYARDTGPIGAQTIGFCDPAASVDASAMLIAATTGQVRTGQASDVTCP